MKAGTYHEQLKIAKLVPIHKGDELEITENYRPLSIINLFSKIIER